MDENEREITANDIAPRLMEERQVPYSIEAEQAVLGSIM